MRGEWSGRGLKAFDYHYETYSHGKHGRRTHHHWFSAVIVSSDVPLKSLYVRPENFLDKRQFPVRHRQNKIRSHRNQHRKRNYFVLIGVWNARVNVNDLIVHLHARNFVGIKRVF